MTVPIDIDVVLNAIGYIAGARDITDATQKMLKPVGDLSDAHVRLVKSLKNGIDWEQKTVRVFEQMTAEGHRVRTAVQGLGAQAKITGVNIKALTADQIAFNESQRQARIQAEKTAKSLSKSLSAKRGILFKGLRGKGEAPSRGEEQRLKEAERALARFVERNKIARKTVDDLFTAYKTGVPAASKATDGLRAAVYRVVEAWDASGNAARKAADVTAKAASKAARAAKKVQDKANEQTARYNRRQQTQAAVRQGVDLGRGTKQQVASFVAAERALLGIAQKSDRARTSAIRAFREARRGTLTYTNALTKAQQAAVKLAAAHHTIGTQASLATRSVKRLAGAIVDMGRLVGISLIIGSAFRLQQALEDSFTATLELSKRVAEIDTIQQEAALSTQRWADELRTLSGTFGIDTLQQAEGAYQTLSNQVAQGAEAIQFLGSANRLALAGVTSTAASVNLLTATINAFRLPVEDADNVAAQLFKTVELGRVRIEEMAETFGRVAVPSSLLGISLDELLGSLAQITIQGVKFNEASTLVRNVLQKLIRPTDRMKEIFAELGVSTGKALIAQRGLPGALAAIEKATGGAADEIGEAYGRIRAITGAFIFAGKGAEEAAEKIRQVAAAGGDLTQYLGDVDKVLDSTGQQLDIAAEKAKNFFQKEFGEPATRAVVELIKELGGVEKVLQDATFALKLSLRAAQIYAAFMAGPFIVSVFKAEGAIHRLTVALAANPFGAAVVAIAAILAIYYESQIEYYSRIAKEAEESNLAVIASHKKAANEAATIAAKETRVLSDAVKKRTQIILTSIANERRAVNARAAEIRGITAETDRQFNLVSKSFISRATKQANTFKTQVTKVAKDAKAAVKLVEDSFKDLGAKQLAFDLGLAGLGQQLSVLDTEIAASQKKAQDATSTGDLKTFKEASKRVQELYKQRADSQVALEAGQRSLEKRLKTAQKARRDARTSADRKAAKLEIEGIRKEQILLQKGTKAELAAAKNVQEVKKKALKATTGAEKSAVAFELREVQKEQQAIEDALIRERTIRGQIGDVIADQAKQLETIRQKNEEAGKAAAKEENRIRIGAFLYKLITKEIEAFNKEKLLEKGTAEQILKGTAEQQERFGKIIALQRLIGGGAEAERLVRERSVNLEKGTEVRLQQLLAEAKQKSATKARDVINADLEAAKAARAANSTALTAFEQRLRNLSEVLKAVPEAELGTNPSRVGQLLGAPDPGVVTGQTAAARETQLKQLKELQTNASRLAELVKILQTTSDPAAAKELKTLFGQVNATLITFQDPAFNVVKNEESTLQRLTPQVRALGAAIVEAQQRGGASPFGQLPKLIEEQQTRLGDIDALSKETAELGIGIENLIKKRGKEGEAIDKTALAFEKLGTPLERARKNIGLLRDLSEGIPINKEIEELTFAKVPKLPEKLPSVVKLTEDEKKAFGEAGGEVAEEFKEGVKNDKAGIGEALTPPVADAMKAGAAAAKPAMEETARAASAAYTAAQKADAPSAAEYQVKLEADARRRADALGLNRPRGGRREDRAGNITTRTGASRGDPRVSAGGVTAPPKTAFADTPAGQKLQATLDAMDETNKELIEFLKKDAANKESQKVKAELEKLIPSKSAEKELAKVRPGLTPKKEAELVKGENLAESARAAAALKAELDKQEQRRGIVPDSGDLYPDLDAARATHRAALEERDRQVKALEGEPYIAAFDEQRIALREAMAKEVEARKALIADLKTARDLNKKEDRSRAFDRAQATKGLSARGAEAALAGDIRANQTRKKALTDEEKAARQRRYDIGIVGAREGTGKGDATITTDMVKAATALREAAEANKTSAQLLAEAQLRNEKVLRAGAAKGFAEGGPVSGAAGRDRIPAMLSNGEFVINAASTRRFYPQLMAMNTGRLRPQGFADGGPVDVGGVNVTVNESSSPQTTARQVVSEINRGIRTGTIKIRRS